MNLDPLPQTRQVNGFYPDWVILNKFGSGLCKIIFDLTCLQAYSEFQKYHDEERKKMKTLERGLCRGILFLHKYGLNLSRQSSSLLTLTNKRYDRTPRRLPR